MELTRVSGLWTVSKFNPYPFELQAECMLGNGFEFSVDADSTRLEIFAESEDRRYPMTPAVNYVVDDEVEREDLVQLLKDIRITVAKIQGSLKESYDSSYFRDGLVEAVDTFVESVND